jgi:signal transduction histidine kinase
MQVNITHDSVPRFVSPETALCLFRIVQEGLRNAKKHSGASSAQVALEVVGDALHVSVCDQGIGFNIKDIRDSVGLGVRSMGERAHLLGGRFEIHSEPHKGTRIDAWVPVQVPAGTAAD